MVRLHTRLIAPVILLLSLTVGVKRADAQTFYPFEATFLGENTLVPIQDNISKVTIIAESTDAPFGLTRLINNAYAQLDVNTGRVIFRPDAAAFGLQNQPLATVTFFGTGNDKLFGTVSGEGQLDFQNFVGTTSGTFNITGGEGRFRGAIGTFSFFENDTFSSDLTAPIKSRAVIRGSFQTIPEPNQAKALLSISALLICLVSYKRVQSV